MPRLALCLGVGAALLLASVAVCRRGRDWVRSHKVPPSRCLHGSIYLEAFTWRVVAIAVAAWIHGVLGPYPTLHVVWPLSVLAAVVYGFVRVRSFEVPLADWGWSHTGGVSIDVAAGVLVGLLLGPMGLLLGRVAGAAELASYEAITAGLSVVLWAPLAEETLFRGILYRALRDRMSSAMSIASSAAIFGLLHFPLTRFPQIFAYGLAFALLREWRGSLVGPVVAHMVTNVVVVVSS